MVQAASPVPALGAVPSTAAALHSTYTESFAAGNTQATATVDIDLLIAPAATAGTDWLYPARVVTYTIVNNTNQSITGATFLVVGATGQANYGTPTGFSQINTGGSLTLVVPISQGLSRTLRLQLQFAAAPTFGTMSVEWVVQATAPQTALTGGILDTTYPAVRVEEVASQIQEPVDIQSTYQVAVQSTTSALAASATYVGSWVQVGTNRALFGTIYTDQSGVLYIDQSSDGTNPDDQEPFVVTGGVQRAFATATKAPYARLRLVNGPTAQTTLRLYLWAASVSTDGVTTATRRVAYPVLVLGSTAYTASGNTPNLPVAEFSELAVDVNVTAVSGTSPTLNLYLDRLGGDGNWYNIWASAQITAVGTVSTTVGAGCATNQAFGNWVRLRWVIGGTSPSFTFSASIIGK